MQEKKNRANMQEKNNMTNGVVITVYVESSRTRSSKLSEDPINKTKPHPCFKMPHAAGTQGHDRRSQLLAYSRHLRNAAGSEKVQVQVQQPINKSQPRSKKRLWLPQPVRICSPSTQMSPGSISSRSKKRKGSGSKCYLFWRKLKNILKKLSCKEIKQ